VSDESEAREMVLKMWATGKYGASQITTVVGGPHWRTLQWLEEYDEEHDQRLEQPKKSGAVLRYIVETDQWAVYDGIRWIVLERGEIPVPVRIVPLTVQCEHANAERVGDDIRCLDCGEVF
jgi:hypothetical protein